MSIAPSSAGNDALSAYRARFLRVLAHIDTHADKRLSVDALSAVAAYSPFHFHRQFSALFGIGVAEYIRLLRLRRASYRLAFRAEDTISGIARDASYEDAETFTRTFRRVFGQTPGAFRHNPDWQAWHAVYARLETLQTIRKEAGMAEHRVDIVDFPETRVAVLRHSGPPDQIGATIRRFIEWRKSVGLSPSVSATFNILHDDPSTTPPEDFRLDLCAATDGDIAPNNAGVVPGVIPGGRCAVLRYVGNDAGFGEAVRYLYGNWLPQSGEDLRDVPPFCQRVRFFPDVPEHEAVTDIFLPLA